MAISQGTEQGECDTMIHAMENPAAKLRHVDVCLADLYLQSLIDSLNEKKQQAAERSLNSDYTADVYDELLTGAEIQDQIDTVNRFAALERIVLAVVSGDEHRMMDALNQSIFGIKHLHQQYASAYMGFLRVEIANRGGNHLRSNPKCFT